jgi:hypothetical protein
LDLEQTIDAIIRRPTQSSDRLLAMADFIKDRLAAHGLPAEGTRGGTGGELKVRGLARTKDWDVAYEFAGKFRLLISLKSMWRNASGTVPNRIDDHMDEVANVQQLHPEIVIGYVVLFDEVADSTRKDGLKWSEFFEQAIQRIAIRKAPLWNQGLLEGSWFIRFNSTRPLGQRLAEPDQASAVGDAFILDLLRELHRREPAIPFTTLP